MTYLSINDLYYKHEGFGTLMGHYAAMYSICMDTGLIPAIYKTSNKFAANSAMEFFNPQPNAITHREAFTNFDTIFEILEENIYKQINWTYVNFQEGKYNQIIDYIRSNINLHYNCYWSLSKELCWNHIDDIVNKLFVFNKELIAECKTLLPSTEKEICGISIRNQYKTFNCPHTKLSIDYYIEAMNLFDKHNTKFLIFSDDIEESKKMLSSINNAYDIEYTGSMASAQGMCSMSICNHIINANSSFSFWASVINHNKDKKIIYPNHFIDPQADIMLAKKINHKWCPNEWIGLDSV